MTKQETSNRLALPENMKLGETGLLIRGHCTRDEWLAVAPEFRRAFDVLAVKVGRIQWAIGDWLIYGEERFSEESSQALNDIGFEQGKIDEMVGMAKRFKPEHRVPGLSWSHHRTVRSLPDKERAAGLRGAQEQGWSVTRLRQWVTERNEADKIAKGENNPSRNGSISPTQSQSMTAKEAGGIIADKLREEREAREAEALQSRRVDARGAAGQTAGGLPMPLMPEPETVEASIDEDKDAIKEAFATRGGGIVAALKALHDAAPEAWADVAPEDVGARIREIRGDIEGADLHAACVSREEYDKLAETVDNQAKAIHEWRLKSIEAHAEARNLQSQLDAYVDSCVRFTPASKEYLQWLRERRAPVGGALPDEDETLEWALERVVAKVKSDMGRKR